MGYWVIYEVEEKRSMIGNISMNIQIIQYRQSYIRLVNNKVQNKDKEMIVYKEVYQQSSYRLTSGDPFT